MSWNVASWGGNLSDNILRQPLIYGSRQFELNSQGAKGTALATKPTKKISIAMEIHIQSKCISA